MTAVEQNSVDEISKTLGTSQNQSSRFGLALDVLFQSNEQHLTSLLAFATAKPRSQEDLAILLASTNRMRRLGNQVREFAKAYGAIGDSDLDE